jgi:hypothetical protein
MLTTAIDFKASNTEIKLKVILLNTAIVFKPLNRN